MVEIRFLCAWVATRVRDQQSRRQHGEVLPWVIITALLAAAAIAIVAIIVTKATNAAKKVKTQ